MPKYNLEQDWKLTLDACGGGHPSPVDDLLAEVLPPTVSLFRSKARDYSERSGIFTADLLGARGQFAEIWRKIPKLKKGMWDGETLENESVEEILQDIIGHCILALGYVNQSQKNSFSPKEERA